MIPPTGYCAFTLLILSFTSCIFSSAYTLPSASGSSDSGRMKNICPTFSRKVIFRITASISSDGDVVMSSSSEQAVNRLVPQIRMAANIQNFILIIVFILFFMCVLVCIIFAKVLKKMQTDKKIKMKFHHIC